MEVIESLKDLEAHYGTPSAPSLVKVADHISPSYRPFVERARFAVFTTVGPEGTDASPRGDEGPVVTVIDRKTLALPDRRGNNRIDSLRNIVADGRCSLMLMIPGSTNVIRINGKGRLTADEGLRRGLAVEGKEPRTVTLIAVEEVYFQCARALMRADLWKGEDQSAGLPSAGDILSDMTGGEVGGKDYDLEWPARASSTMW